MSRRAALRIVAVDGELVAAQEPPAVEPAARAAANDATPAAPGWGPEAAEARATLADMAASRRWRSLPTLTLSLAIHAVLIAAAVAALTRAGSEAETDAVAVEIVFEAPPAPAAEPVASEAIMLAPDAATEALLAESPAVEAPEAEPVEPAEAAEPTLATPVEQPVEPISPVEIAGFVPALDTATEALLAEPPLVEAPEKPEAVETAEPYVATPIERSAETVLPVEATDIVPASDTATDALLAEPPVVEASAPAAAEPIPAPQAVGTPVVELPVPDPALAILGVPPTFTDTADIVPLPAAADPLGTSLPESVAATPSPRPQALPPVAKAKPAPPAQAKKPATRKTAEAAKAKDGTAEARKPKADTPAQAKPAPAAKKAAARPAAKGPARAQASSGAAASAGASAGAEAAYGRKLLSHIERRKRYPAAARAANANGAVRLSLTIDRSGQLRSARVTGGSGHAVLDEEALATARRAAPYPAPPDGVGGKTYAFSVTLRFSR